MTGFEDIPEDKKEAYPCECGGNIVMNEKYGYWECDSCDWSATNEKDDVQHTDIKVEMRRAEFDTEMRLNAFGHVHG